MARIRRHDGSSPWIIPSRCLIGRSSVCAFRVETPETSAEHALLRWRSGAWELQDLHSRNGTYVNGRRLASGGRIGLEMDASLGFGYPDQFTLFDLGPPEPHAVGIEAPFTAIEMQDGLLVLPGPEEPEVALVHRDSRWWLERAEEIHPIGDGDVVVTRAGRFRLHLPEKLPWTRDAADVAPTLATLTLRFVVRDGGDTIELVAIRGDQRIDFKARAHHAPLLALAQARLNARGRFTDELGWVDQEELLRQLGCDTNRLHVDIHRIRRQFAAAGILDAVHVIERREGTRQLRVGVARLEIIDVDRPPDE